MLDSVTSSAVDKWQSVPPPTSCESSPGQLSAACALLAVLVQSQSTTQTGSKVDIELNEHKMEALKKQLADAIQAAHDAANDSGFFGFLGDIFGSDIAQIAGAVAAVAAAVATGGAAAPLLLVTLSEAMELGAKAGAELGLAPELCMALSIASVGLGLCSGLGATQAIGEVADTARGVKMFATVVEGGATITGGVLHGVSGYYQSQQLNDQADATGFQSRSDSASLDIDDAIAQLKRALHTEQHLTTTASEIVHSNEDANTSLSARI